MVAERPRVASLRSWLSSWLRFGSRSQGSPARARYYGRWTVFGVLIGAVAGLGAIAFFWLLQNGTRVAGLISGYLPPTPTGEGASPGAPATHQLLVPLVVALGGLVSGLLVRFLAPEAEGHGTDAAIEAFHEHGGRARFRAVPVKTLASAIMIGSGGSGGREGPTAQISAGFGALMGGLLRLETHERRLLVATGIGAGIGAIFRAPLGGAVLAAEILYIEDLEVEALYPGLIASVVGYSIFASWAGWQPIFGAQPDLGLDNPLQLAYYAGIGLVCGVFGRAYAWAFYGVSDVFRRLPLPTWVKPALGGLGVGLLGLLVPGVLGTGYGWLQHGLTRAVLATPLWLLCLVPLAKILATSLSIGSGGSGGIFGPGMVIGGSVGVALWRLSVGVLPGVPPSPSPYAIVAMMALFGSIAHAPLAVMLMVAEMTGNLSLLAPAMIAIGLATAVVGERTIYTSQKRTRADSPAHRIQFTFPLLGTLTVQEAMAPARHLLRPDMSVAEAEKRLAAAKLSGAPVVDDNAQLVGVLTLADLARAPSDVRETRRVGDLMTREPLAAERTMTLDDALEALATSHVSWMPVLATPERRVIGRTSAAAIVTAYRTAFGSSVRRLRGVAKQTVIVDYHLEPGSYWVGRSLGELRLPADATVVALRRDGTGLPPRSETTLAEGDTLSIATTPLAAEGLRDALGSAADN